MFKNAGLAQLAIVVVFLLTSCSGQPAQIQKVSAQEAMPKGFSLPAYPGATSQATGLAKQQMGGSATVVMSSNDKPEKVGTFYKEQLKTAGWTVKDGISVGRMSTMQCLKGADSANIVLNWDPTGHTTITLAVLKH